MKLIEALEIIKRPQPANAETFRVSLICGFTPLHLQTFLNAELRQALSAQQVQFSTGLYGDFWGNLQRAAHEQADVVVIAVEWSDLDGRLGLRNLGGWTPRDLENISRNVRSRAKEFVEMTGRLAEGTRVVVCFPTLPLAPVAFQPPWLGSGFELESMARVASMACELSRVANVKVVSPQALELASPLANRSDVKAELASGFPYKLLHASTMAEMIARLVQPVTAKKGLITDLDDTLWQGILGDDGCDGVHWDLEHHAHMHGAYQRMLHALAEAGVLIAVASKNDSKFVDEVLQRRDLIVPRNVFFPIEAHWGAKSGSVAQILKTWNVGADSVVFIDDSPLELAEVKAVHPEVECILFPKDDPQAIADLFLRLRGLFGKQAISEEDAIRRESIRNAKAHRVDDRGERGAPAAFLEQAEAEISFSALKKPLDPRALELVNKTNQFNLNGRRYTEASWQNFVKQSETTLLVVSYRDKFGPLGKIAVLAGRKVDGVFELDTWVMSCRAFGRRIEHRSLEELFDRTGANEIAFAYELTAKNGPLQDLLQELQGEAPAPGCRLSRERFAANSGGKTLHRVMEAVSG